LVVVVVVVGLDWIGFTIQCGTLCTTGFFEEPIYQLGLTAKAAEAAAANGVQYYSAAGNTFDNSYETIYKGIPCPPEVLLNGPYTSCVDFGNGNPRQELDVRTLGNVTIYWDQPWGSISGPPGTQLDFDAYLFNSDFEIATSSINFNSGGDAFEELVIVKPGIFTLSIPFIADPFSPFDQDPDGTLMKWISFGPKFNSVNPGPVNSSTVFGPANSPNVAAVAAAFSQQTLGQIVAEPFTALGGTPMIFDDDGNRYPEPITLPQPRFTGSDGYVTS
jgi:hypothetical protein